MILPFTYPWIIKRHLAGCKNILDVGCGDGSFLAKINSEKLFNAIGVDLFEPYVKKARRLSAYKKVIKKDVMKISFKSGSFDVVHTSQLIEHLEKKEGLKLIEIMEKIAKNKVVIGTPNGHFHQDSYDENKLQEHKSSWSERDFRKLGYKCYGQALKFIYGEKGLLETNTAKKFTILRPILFCLSYFLSPISYFIPKLGAHIVAVKEID